MHRQARSLVMMVVLSALVTGIPSCSKETEEDRVKKAVMNVQRAAEEKKIGALLEHVSKAYADPQGNDYNAIKGLLAYYFFRHQKVSVHIPSIEVQVSGPSATARFQAVLTARGTDGATAGAVLPDALGVYDFEASLRKEDGWKVLSARWTRLGDTRP